MAESTSVALAAAPIPSSADIARAEKLVRERFLHEGEDPSVALAEGTPRRRALDSALAELAENPKATTPSTEWRREFSLLLGLERILSEEEPKLADGTVLSAHQVDALSGTLTALLAEAQRDEAAATYCSEGDEPYGGENRDLGAELGQEDRSIAERAEPQEIHQHLVGESQDNQDYDNDRGKAEQDNPRSRQCRLLRARRRAQRCSRARAPRSTGTAR